MAALGCTDGGSGQESLLISALGNRQLHHFLDNMDLVTYALVIPQLDYYNERALCGDAPESTTGPECRSPNIERQR